ncbi:MucBP domain-containing protein [Streptococcus dysgalactiae]|uniref:MucBP domain-containing protein n=1 Tax=Streptococcus dysgalactiae TaxID=1334 RepID=UPI00163D8B0D|nr:MucBP domain-containing protein [Streptococcus dysgalactiae]
MFEREKSRFSIRKNKCYGACSVFLGLTILTLAMAGGNVKAEEVNGEQTSELSIIAETPKAATDSYLFSYEEDTHESTVTNEAVDSTEEMPSEFLRAPQPVAATSETTVPTGKDVNDKITVVESDFLETERTVDPNSGDNFAFRTTFKIQEGVQSGDTFTITLSETINGIGDDNNQTKKMDSLFIGKDEIATGTYDVSTNKITYTFTDKVNGKHNLSGRLQFPVFVDRRKVPFSTTITAGATVANNRVIEENVQVKYKVKEENNILPDVFALITSVNTEKKEVEYVVYVNPLKHKIPNGVLAIYGDSKSITSNIEGININDYKDEGVIFSDNQVQTKLEFYALKDDRDRLPDSFGIDREKFNSENISYEIKKLENGSNVIISDFQDKLSSGKSYVIVLTSQYKEEAKNLFLESLLGEKDSKVADGVISTHQFKYGMAEANEDKIGQFQEHHIFEIDGKEYLIHSPIFEGIVDKNEKYFTERFSDDKLNSQLLRGSLLQIGVSEEIVNRIKKVAYSNAEKPLNNPAYSPDGTREEGLYEANLLKEITYRYKVELADLTGSFQEHHDYYDMERAFDGTILKRTKNPNLSYSGQIQSGKETEHYTTQKHEQDDYQFLTVTEPKNNPTYDKSGNRVEGDFVANVKKEVTYEYEKVSQPGRFEDTHKYFINYVDANGQVIRTEEVNSLTNQYREGMPEWDEYVAYPLEKDGFVFKTTSDDKLTNPGNFDKETKITRGSYIPGEMQHITYNYYKDVLLSGTVIATYSEFGTGQPLSDAVFATYGKTDKGLPNGAGQLNDDYVTVAKDIPGYHLVEQPENAKGKVSEGVTYVHYLYQKDKEPLGTVIVRHIEFGTGKELAPSEYATYDNVPAGVPAGSTIAGTGYETKPAQIDGYDLVEVPEDDYGNVFEGITRLTYVYKKQAQPLGTVIVRHIEFGTGKELAPSEYATYDDVPAGVPAGSTVAGTGYETKPAQIDGYDLVEVPEDDYGNVFEGITRLTYVYKKQAQPLGTVIVRHIEFGTGKELAPSEYATYDDVPAGVPEGSTVAGTGYETKPAQIDGYDLVEVPEDDYGNVFEGITRLTYVYKKQIITGQGEIIDFELESNGDESGQNEQPDEISEHGPLVELEYPSQEGMSGENAGTVEVEENAPIVELDYPSQEGMSGENAGTVEIEEGSPIVELDYPSQEAMSGENAGTVEVEENAPIIELDYPSQEGMSGENTGQQTIEEDTPTVTIEEKPVVKPVSSQPSKAELPATGERSETAVTVLGLALSALGLTFIRKRKQN